MMSEDMMSAFIESLATAPDGRQVDPDDIDGLIDAYEESKAVADQWYAFNRRIRELIGKHAEGEGKTLRVRGHERRAKLTLPDDGWDQSILKEAFNAYPQFRDEVLSIASLRVKAREWKKIKNETGPADFETFRSMIENANKGPQGLPTITIEA